jgi:tRNA-modifying protein YgfZ
MPMPDLAVIPLEHLDALSIRGPDARGFLQGQLSQDLDSVTPSTPRLAGLHDPQGRCLALLRLFALDADQWLAVMPRELIAPVSDRLRRYVLRSRVQLAPATSQWRAYGVWGPDAAAAAATRAHQMLDAAEDRALVIAPRLEALPDGETLDEQNWHAQDIRAGLPQVFAATSGLFTAQMLNLDLVDGVSFTKGCYTGQEIIARTHYLGQSRRRLHRFHTLSELPLAPATPVTLADGRRARIVNAAPAEGGGQEFLAVTQVPGAASADMSTDATDELLQVEEFALPYATT